MTHREKEGYPVVRAVAELVRTGSATFHHVSKDPFVLVRTHGSA